MTKIVFVDGPNGIVDTLSVLQGEGDVNEAMIPVLGLTPFQVDNIFAMADTL